MALEGLVLRRVGVELGLCRKVHGLQAAACPNFHFSFTGSKVQKVTFVLLEVWGMAMS